MAIDITNFWDTFDKNDKDGGLIIPSPDSWEMSIDDPIIPVNPTPKYSFTGSFWV